MKADDELRRELDKVVPFRPQARRGKAAGKAPRQLSTIWADDIVIELGGGGLVDGLLGSTALTVLYGESGAGKTFVAVDLACHVAAGLPWRGMAVEQGVVVYVAAESPESVKRRLWAWKRHHGVDRLPVLVVQSAVDLLNGDAEALAEMLAGLRERHGRVALTVVDTLARAMTGNENLPDDMGRFVAACGRLREAAGGHVLVVHHSGKDTARGARGHSCLRAATDVELEVTNGEGGGSVRVTKHRDEAGGASYGFRLERVELGTNAKDRVVTTCVAVESEAPAGGTRDRAGQSRLSPSGRIAAQALRAALNSAGERPPDHDVTRGVHGAVRLATWRTFFTQTYGNEAEDSGKEAERKAWQRGRESALAAGTVRVWGEWAWFP